MKQKIKNVTSLIAMIGITISMGFSQSKIWSDNYIGNGMRDAGYDVHVGGDGRIYACGAQSTNTESLLISYSSNGNRNWVATQSGPTIELTSLTTFGTGSSIRIYGVGTKQNAWPAVNDAFIVKYNQNGTMVAGFPKTWNCSANGQDWGVQVLVDASENIYVLVFANTSGGDITVLKYNSSGTLLWTSIYNSSGTQQDNPTYMALNSAGTYLYVAGNTLVAGTASNTVATVIRMRTSDGSFAPANGGFVATYNNNNNNDGDDAVHSLDVINLSGGSEYVYAVGSTRSINNGLDALLLKYTTSGALSCSSTYNGVNNLDDIFRSVDVTAPADNIEVYVTGFAKIDLGCDSDILTRKYNSACTAQWTQTFNGGAQTCPAYGITDEGFSIKWSPYTSKAYVAGNSFSTPLGYGRALIRYNSATGNQEWIDIYNRNSGADRVAAKFPLELQYDVCHGSDYIYVTGSTAENTLSEMDATTYMYALTGPCTESYEVRYMQESESADITAVTGIYPNPFDQVATLRISGEEADNIYSLLVFDVMGNEVKYISNIATKEIQMEGGELKDGIYFYQLILNGAIKHSGKFIIAR